MQIDHNIKVVCRKIECYLGHVPHIGNVASSLDDTLEEFLKTTPHWESEIELLGYSKVEAG